MLRIRKLADVRTPANRSAVADVKEILIAQFPGMSPEEIDKLPDQLEDPLRFRLRTELFVAESRRGGVRGFALLSHAPDLAFCLLDTISVAPGGSGRGLGDALYERVREESAGLGAKGLYFECLPDDPAGEPNPDTRRMNRARLRFYERYGARPIVGTLYETPVTEGDTGAPYLVFDGLGEHSLPGTATLRSIVRAILERKYAELCPPSYVSDVVDSIRDGQVRLRDPVIKRASGGAQADKAPVGSRKIVLVVNADHDIHHVRERGYVEAPVRVAAIEREISAGETFERVPALRFPDRWIRAVHDGALVDFIERTCRDSSAKKPLYPYVFPIRNPDRRPRDRSVLAGYWCIDTFTPLDANVWPAARGAVDCALTAAAAVLDGAALAYALVRPPGHHAERRVFGGFCYFNNAAVAANYLSQYGRVAVLDIDYHHGNGTQDIFYERSDVLTASVHGHPSFAYPYFAGFRDEAGRGAGAGFNFNLPLAETVTSDEHRAAVKKALQRVAQHEPAYLVLSLGFDTAAGDPTGTWPNRAADFRRLGSVVGAEGYPTVIVQEGGYRVRTLGTNARAFFEGLISGYEQDARIVARRFAKRKPKDGHAAADVEWRESIGNADIESIRRLVASTGVFSSDEERLAAELVEARVVAGPASGYEFIVAEQDGRLLGYTCYGPVPATDGRFDLYWIAVAPEARGQGFGRTLIERTETAVRGRGGKRLYVETSSTDPYAPAHRLYRRAKFRKAAELPDFYRDGDSKIVLVKSLDS